MTVKLSEDQKRAIAGHGGGPIRVVDADTNDNYVLLRSEQFEAMKALFSEEEVSPRETYPLIDRVMEEDDASDPTLESYQNLQKPPS